MAYIRQMSSCYVDQRMPDMSGYHVRAAYPLSLSRQLSVVEIVLLDLHPLSEHSQLRRYVQFCVSHTTMGMMLSCSPRLDAEPSGILRLTSLQHFVRSSENVSSTVHSEKSSLLSWMITTQGRRTTRTVISSPSFGSFLASRTGHTVPCRCRDDMW